MLPGLAPHHTREGFGSRSRLYIEKAVESPDDFLIEAETGMWLLPPEIAERDRVAGGVKLGEIAILQTEAELDELAEWARYGQEILHHTTVTETGCMIGGVETSKPDDPDETSHTDRWAHYFAEQERKLPVLNEVEELPFIKVCGTIGCYNSRHFDFDYGRDRSVELNPTWFEEKADGDIATIWGDSLGSLEDSLKLFAKFQRSHYPFVPYADSPLTPSGAAYTRFHPLTGCWESWNYNRKPIGAKGGRFEGYGNLYVRYRGKTCDPTTGEVIPEKRRGHWLAHRVMWQVMGNTLNSGEVLNHLCNYKRCCNPQHLEQVSESYNVRHGNIAQAAIKAVSPTEPKTVSPEDLAKYHERARALYVNIAARYL